MIAAPFGCPAWIGLGANLGEPARALAVARDRISTLADTTVTAISSLYRSAPVEAGGPDYLNQVVAIRCLMSPEALLTALLTLEAEAGRERGPRNAPRPLDLDLLLAGDADETTCPPQIRVDGRLTLPHPRLHRRLFVLMPLVEIAPAVEVPGLGQARRLLEDLRQSPEGRAQRCERLPGTGPGADR